MTRLPDRPSRRMPSLATLCRFHGLEVACIKCGRPDDIERAHVIDRCFGGLDGPQNLRPLCSTCHRYQPVFDNGDEAAALEWFDTGGSPLWAVARVALKEAAAAAGLTPDEFAQRCLNELNEVAS